MEKSDSIYDDYEEKELIMQRCESKYDSISNVILGSSLQNSQLLNTNNFCSLSLSAQELFYEIEMVIEDNDSSLVSIMRRLNNISKEISNITNREEKDLLSCMVSIAANSSELWGDIDNLGTAPNYPYLRPSIKDIVRADVIGGIAWKIIDLIIPFKKETIAVNAAAASLTKALDTLDLNPHGLRDWIDAHVACYSLED